uniref:digalactosyldiacylglycerol synthase n=1 Tax=Rhodosorus marinus TaxID=101924 RepID=A0A7S3EEA0_9RHOD|mmetsp:Transcript_29873/g.114675  ORF Transcript_29873/g.114675 Transcript_29873/m.114675 type:complete len:533 (+) Transcript_29873:489-2087(+)|eukprot:CAMPEP_0113960248 /NCGR_PEP_ID=MMETSP0011_2-20120614/4605_1 /TAXON_ID=101924 /ORGANISM="Rhodosorus marinus" /LENGTH=532 /DNA_ID=CAMNT_0000971671 /DNA_START=32 /DNA_END=1630 /DNA_ORIENTATION=- /assembly_acc=CAM_ASM_000156
MKPLQAMLAAGGALALRATLRNPARTINEEDEDEEFPGLPIVPTLLCAAGWSLFAWIGLAQKDDMIQTDEQVEIASDLSDGGRTITIVTTASVPWLTGTAVNPAIRAVELAKLDNEVTLVLPWLLPQDQPSVFSGKVMFQSPAEQAQYVREWMKGLYPLPEDEDEENEMLLPEIRFYAGGYSKEVGSVFPLSDIVKALPQNTFRDMLILEEPEHLTWYYYGDRLTHQYRYVVGIIHTNYFAYAMNWAFPVGLVKGPLLWAYNKWCTRAHTHRIIKLSDAMQGFPRAITANVHGVRSNFLEIGKSTERDFSHDFYFVGKLVWQKGYNRLVPLLKNYYRKTGEALPMEWFGSGDDANAIYESTQREVALHNIICRGQAVDHVELTNFKALINASDSEGLATVTLEAIAMGKFVVIIDHSCNHFFRQFPNALFYRNQSEFIGAVQYAASHQPNPLTEAEVEALSWSGAMSRFVDAVQTKQTRGAVDNFASNALARMMKISSCKLFSNPEYAEIMEEVKREREGRDTLRSYQVATA